MVKNKRKRNRKKNKHSLQKLLFMFLVGFVLLFIFLNTQDLTLNKFKSTQIIPKPTVQLPTSILTPTQIPVYVPNDKCSNLFNYFENEYFSICYPSDMSLSRYGTSEAQFSNNNFYLAVTPAFAAPGGLPKCYENIIINVDGQELKTTAYKQAISEDNDTLIGCGRVVWLENYFGNNSNFRLVYGSRNYQSDFETISESIKKEKQSSIDYKKYLIIKNSLKIKKYFEIYPPESDD
ncbi:MAG: hypothetical protein A2171_02210 [Candidatus Levybacteria bacterium RBG_13_35_9]|nr:MAG: hypothetical protein A2171_02210 [Candidatus Levybacteria bacterium RBG_13_35_9]